MSEKWVVDERTGCWVWLLYRDPRGYGRLTFRNKQGTMAHRWAWERVNGPIPEGMTVDHLCFNPGCVNPDHLRLLTHSENTRNQRQALKTHCVNGHEFTPENTYLKPGARNGSRTCRTCQREAVRKYQERTRRAA